MKEDGGPAFPHDDSLSAATRPGMTLRDYFAGKAITGCLTGALREPDYYAAWAYRMADAMIKERNAT